MTSQARQSSATCECDPLGEGLDHHVWCGRYRDPRLSLADPTHVVVTDGSPEAEASVMRARLETAAWLEGQG